MNDALKAEINKRDQRRHEEMIADRFSDASFDLVRVIVQELEKFSKSSVDSRLVEVKEEMETTARLIKRYNSPLEGPGGNTTKHWTDFRKERIAPILGLVERQLNGTLLPVNQVDNALMSVNIIRPRAEKFVGAAKAYVEVLTKIKERDLDQQMQVVY